MSWNNPCSEGYSFLTCPILENHMKITVTNPYTIFGIVVKSFDNYVDAMKWIEVCLDNDLECVVEKA